jgi:hypothetical protein
VGIAILEELLSNPTPEASKGKSREAAKQWARIGIGNLWELKRYTWTEKIAQRT